VKGRGRWRGTGREGSLREGRGRDPTPSRPLIHISGYAPALISSDFAFTPDLKLDSEIKSVLSKCPANICSLDTILTWLLKRLADIARITVIRALCNMQLWRLSLLGLTCHIVLRVRLEKTSLDR